MSNSELYRTVREAMMKQWDPIGVASLKGAEDEYDSYVPLLCDLLLLDVSRECLFELLWSLETRYMGLSGNRQRRKKTQGFADWLFRLRREADMPNSCAPVPG